jgi:hypothetical protein
MRKLAGLILVLSAATGCNASAPADKTAQAKAAADKSVEQGYFLNGGNVLRCSTPDGGFTTICRTP